MEMFVEQERVFSALDRGLKERKTLQDVAKEIIGIPTAKVGVVYFKNNVKRYVLEEDMEVIE